MARVADARRGVRVAACAGWGILMAAVAVGVTEALVPLTGRPFFFAAFPLVMLSALVAGAAAGVLSTVLATAAYSLLYFPPLNAIGVASRADAVRLLGFALSAALVAALSGALRSAYRRERILRDRAARASAALRERSEEEARSKDAFLATLGHELRNPLAPMRNALAILDHSGARGPRCEGARAVLRRQLEHFTRLVDDLLDVSRIASGKIRLERRPMDLRASVRRTVEDHRTVFETRGVSLRLVEPEGPLWIDGDATRITQLVGNLLQNAAKFTDAGGHVVVTVARRSERAEIAVRDDGIGIEPEVLPRLFRRFAQAGAAAGRSQGLGLGLDLVRGLAELHGGAVRATSAGRGEGAEFTVALPLVEPPPPAVLPVRRAGAARAPRRVLVVDDNADAAVTLAELIALLGHATEVAHDGRTALAMARANPPDVVLCDIGLPDMSGYDLARALRAEGTLAATRLVAITGFAQAKDQVSAAEAGFAEHVAKPLDPERIAALLGDVPAPDRASASTSVPAAAPPR